MMKPTPPCEVCGTPVELEIEMRLSVGYTSTVAVFEHPKFAICPTCGNELHLMVVNLPQVQMKAGRVPNDKRQSVIAPAKVLLA
jgi:hypothetical protein